jgi:hypothetical protein
VNLSSGAVGGKVRGDIVDADGHGNLNGMGVGLTGRYANRNEVSSLGAAPGGNRNAVPNRQHVAAGIFRAWP